jgi:hypothetical protein
VEAAPAPASCWGSVHSGAGVLDGLIYRHNKACSLRGCCQSIDPHHGWLPHKGLEVVSNVLIVDVHSIPHAPLKRRKRKKAIWNCSLIFFLAYFPKDTNYQEFRLCELGSTPLRKTASPYGVPTETWQCLFPPDSC